MNNFFQPKASLTHHEAAQAAQQAAHTLPKPSNNNTRPQRILNLLSHIPTFLFRFLRLVTFVLVLLPAFCVFLWHYLTCDRVAVYYGPCCCDNADTESNNGACCGASSHDKRNTKSRCTVCSPFFSRHYLDIYGSNTTTDNSNTDNNIQSKKPVILFLTGGAYIIGYKMWGTLLARALSPHVLVIVPDYRNYPRVNVHGMVHDIDTSIDWVLNNVEEFGGDASKVVLVGQSAGAHLGGVCVVRKVLDRIRRLRLNKDSLSTADEDAASAADGHDAPFKTSYEATDLCGFISTSSPHNLVTMKQVFHRHGLSCSVQRSIFGGSELDGTDASGQDVFEKWSTFHLAKRCHDEYASLVEGRETEVLNAGVELSLKDLFPNLCIIHGTNDKTVPVEESIEFLSLLSNLQIPTQQRFYEGWTHTDPILEAPMRGNHLYHKDVYDLVRLWTNPLKSYTDESEHKCDDGRGCCNHWTEKGSNGSGSKGYGSVSDACTLPDLDDQDPMLRPICPRPLVEIARICNPF